MNAVSLYHDLKARGVILKAQGELLKVDAPAGVLTEEHRAALKEFKPKLLKLVSSPREELQKEPKRESVTCWTGLGLVIGGQMPARCRCGSGQIEEGRGAVSEREKYWAPEEYADMYQHLTPHDLDEELSRMRAKSEHYRVAEAFGIPAEEAALMRLHARVFAEDPA